MVYRARRRTFLLFYFFFILPFLPWPFISSLWFFLHEVDRDEIFVSFALPDFPFSFYMAGTKKHYWRAGEKAISEFSFLVSVCLKLSSLSLLSQAPYPL